MICRWALKIDAYPIPSSEPPRITTTTAVRGTHDSTSAERAETAGRGVLRDGTEASGCTWTLEPWLESQGLPLRDDRIQISGSRVTTCRTAGKDGDLYHTGKREELRLVAVRERREKKWEKSTIDTLNGGTINPCVCGKRRGACVRACVRWVLVSAARSVAEIKRFHVICWQVFRGNYDRYMIVRQRFARPVTARYFRIHPVTWRSWISMRVEFYGCIAGKLFVCMEFTFLSWSSV